MVHLCIIPARSGSKSVPDKNIRLLNGRPLMSYAILPALKTGLFKHVVVSTNSVEYAQIAMRYGAQVPFLRPAHLAEDVPSERVLKHAIVECEFAYNETYDLVVMLQCTTPLMNHEDIIDCVDKLSSNHLADSSLTVREAKDYPEWMFWMDPLYHELEPVIPGVMQGDRGVRQTLKKVFIPNGACYVTRRETIMDEGLIIGHKPLGIMMPDERSCDIDSEEDFQRVEEIVKRLKL